MSTLTARAGPSALRRPWLRTARRSVGIEAGHLSARVARRPLPEAQEEWSFTTLSLPPTESKTAGSSGLRLPNIAKEARGRREQAVCAISSPAIDVFPLNLQPSDSESLDARVISHARKLISVPLNEAVLDYVPLPDWVKRPTDATLPVLVFSAARDVVEDLLRKTGELGFYVNRLMTPGCALAPLVAGAGPDTRHLIIATSEEATSISVAQNGHVLLERILDWSLNRIVELLRSEFDLAERQSQSLLARWDSKSIDTSVTDSALSSSESFEGDVREVLAPAFRELTREASSCLGYCGSFLQHASTSEIVLVGPLANHALLRNSLESELGLTIHGPKEGLVLAGQTDDPEWDTYATAACCAVECGKEIE
jgi:Tfp pilus assembly PilM family ATPase